VFGGGGEGIKTLKIFGGEAFDAAMTDIL